MVALQQDVTPSLVEAGVAKLSAVRSRRQHREPSQRLAKVRFFLAEVLGSFFALLCFVTAAAFVAPALGLLVAGLSILLLDFKISLIRKSMVQRR